MVERNRAQKEIGIAYIPIYKKEKSSKEGKMKVLFLDIDGVLNTPKSIRQHGVDYIDPILVAHVGNIVAATGVKIVLSSTWRLQLKDCTMVQEALADYFLELHSTTPDLGLDAPGWERFHEIKCWLAAHPEVKRFAILDDFADAADETLAASFFRTDENRGLTAAIAQDVIAHLS